MQTDWVTKNGELFFRSQELVEIAFGNNNDQMFKDLTVWLSIIWGRNQINWHQIIFSFQDIAENWEKHKVSF